MHDLPKKMFDFQRQHPVAAISRALSLIRGNLVTIIVFLVVGARSESFPFLWWIGGGFAFLLIAGVANWWRFQFRIEDGELHIRSGIFVRKNLYLSKDRVQVIDITSGIIQRIFGLVRVDIQTAGSTSREAAIEATTLETAREINRLLRDKADHSPGEPEGESQAESEEKQHRFHLPKKELLIAASTSGSFGIALSIIATVFSQIEPLISESQLFEYLFERLPSQTDAVFFITVITVFVVFAWLLSFFSTLFSYGDFTLTVKKNELVITRGILEKKRVTVPYNRIQAVHVSEGMIRQPLGFASLHLESAGYGDEAGTGSIVLYPLIKKSEIQSFLNLVVPTLYREISGERLPKRSLRRYVFRSSIVVSLIIAGVYFWLDLNNWIWLISGLAMLWGWLKFRDAAIGWKQNGYIFRSRRLSRSTAFIMHNRIQDITLSQSPFQKFRKLCSLTVHVASGDRGKAFSVRDLELESGEKLLNQIKKEKGPEEPSEPLELSTRKIILPGWNQAAN